MHGTPRLTGRECNEWSSRSRMFGSINSRSIFQPPSPEIAFQQLEDVEDNRADDFATIGAKAAVDFGGHCSV